MVPSLNWKFFWYQATIGLAHSYAKSVESGLETEQTVGFVLSDNDIGDSFSTYVYEGPWGTPIFFTDPGSITSAPWERGTTRAVDIFSLEVISPEENGHFDYRDGAHYQFNIQSTGARKLEGAGVDFIFYDLPLSNVKSATVAFNGSGEAPYKIELFKGFIPDDITNQIKSSDGIILPSANIMVSVYPPKRDWTSSEEKEYPVLVQAQSAADYQIFANKMLRPRFADLRAPRATITAPYDGQRISPTLFSKDDFKIEAFSDDEDVAQIQLQIRTIQPDGVYEPWQNLSDMLWQDINVFPEATNTNIEEVVTHTDRDPQRQEFTFSWAESEIKTLGVGEYQLHAVAQDAATTLSTDGKTQTAAPNIDLDPPVITFRVDSSKPSVLTTVPFYQDRESERIYRGELSVTFTDDMRADDFSDRTFEVLDLLDNKSDSVAGFVSYSPTLRKAVFVPVQPFIPNGFYRATIKTDTFDEAGDITESGVHDLAGNPLDNKFSWTFRTTDTPFEETWSITFSVTDGVSTDGGKIASVAFGAKDGEDEKDARAVPRMDTQISLSFLDSKKKEFDRDTRPADGRLGHHWFLVVDNATDGSTVDLKWLPSLKLTRGTRQYQVIKLIEFDSKGKVSNTISLDSVNIDPYGNPVAAYSYTATAKSSYFRLNVMKANMVATKFTNGSSGWKFFSVPINPSGGTNGSTDPFVNLGDDIDPLQMFQYVASESAYKIYPFDLGEVSLQTGHGYFTRLTEDVEVDVGGASNNSDETLTLDVAGWHAIGNPFILSVKVVALLVGGNPFAQAVTDGKIEGTLYRWNQKGKKDGYGKVTDKDTLVPWEGYFIKTLVDNVELTIPAPDGLADAVIKLPDSFKPPLAPPVVQKLKEGEFELRVALTSDSSADLTTSLGTCEKASTGYDVFDLSEPPRLKGTASAYFEHTGWDAKGGLYNTDFKPTLEVGETANWTLVIFTDQPDALMQLSWEEAIGGMPDDILIEFRELGGESTWRDMRSDKFVEIDSDRRRTTVRYEIRATRFALEPISDVTVVAGEAEVKLHWKASDNTYITGYTIYRNAEARYEVGKTEGSFIDTDVEEEASYTYQVGVRFKTGVELKSELFTIKVLPVIKETVLLQSYPNPFNPETWIPYELVKDADVTIEIYNVNGQLVQTLDIGNQPRGRYISKEKSVHWDGRNNYGERVASSVFFYVLRAGDFVATRKMVIMK